MTERDDAVGENVKGQGSAPPKPVANSNFPGQCSKRESRQSRRARAPFSGGVWGDFTRARTAVPPMAGRCAGAYVARMAGLIVFALFDGLALLVLTLWIANAPDGIEDEAGFRALGPTAWERWSQRWEHWHEEERELYPH